VTDLFFRSGTPFTGTPRFDEKGAAFTTHVRTCGRCGGAGGSDAWKFTGWTCYQCGGKGTDGTQTDKLYTAEKLAALDATRAKAAAKRAEKRAVQDVSARARAEANRESFRASSAGALVERARAFADRSPFVADVVRQANRRAAISSAQEAALRKTIDKIAAETLAVAASGWVGTPGERITVPVTVARVATFERQAFRGFGTEMVAITTMRDAAGNAIVVKSASFRAEVGETSCCAAR